jgi:hypothetical protein
MKVDILCAQTNNLFGRAANYSTGESQTDNPKGFSRIGISRLEKERQPSVRHLRPGQPVFVRKKLLYSAAQCLSTTPDYRNG